MIDFRKYEVKKVKTYRQVIYFHFESVFSTIQTQYISRPNHPLDDNEKSRPLISIAVQSIRLFMFPSIRPSSRNILIWWYFNITTTLFTLWRWWQSKFDPWRASLSYQCHFNAAIGKPLAILTHDGVATGLLGVADALVGAEQRETECEGTEDVPNDPAKVARELRAKTIV